MTTFYDFIQAEKQVVTLATGPSKNHAEVGPSMASAVALTLQDSQVPLDKALKFAKDLTELVTSDSFLKELSEEIREPGLTESEDEFAARCKKAMKGLLDRHLG